MDHMNESTENSLRQFEHIEREITARNNADSSNHQVWKKSFDSFSLRIDHEC